LIGQWKKAADDFAKTLELSPELAMANLACTRVDYELGDMKSFMKHMDAYLTVHPDDTFANNVKAWFLATCEDASVRDGKKALEIARKVCAMEQYQEWAACENLAAAYAETGNYDEAVKWAETCLKLAPKEMKPEKQSRVDLYKSKKPLRTPLPKPHAEPAKKPA
jgi:tetratricopeptide (TPR) repeat protein